MRPVRDSQPRRRRRLELEVLQLVANAIGVDRFDLIGASFGAPLAVRWAARKPESVSRLILYCGWVGDVVAAVREHVLGLVDQQWGFASDVLTPAARRAGSR